MKIYFAKSTMRAALMSALIFLASACAALAQEEEFPNFKAMPTGKGIMLVNKKGAPDYAVLIEGGTAAKHDETDGGLRIKTADGGEIIAYYASAKLYAKTKNDSDESLMKNYRAAQIEQFENGRKEKIKIDEDFNGELPVFDLRGVKNDKVPLYTSFWSFPLPGSRPERRIYLAVIIGDSILILRKDLLKGENAQEESRIFTGALKTLTLLPPQKLIPAAKKQPVKPRRKRN